ncbi:MAG TPA: PHB depolymerase family esterase [Bacteroidales bacterium]|nr:PHB depolymerase family esterase [Bacteroidales bacterium]
MRLILIINYLLLASASIGCQNTDNLSDDYDLERKIYRYEGNISVDGHSRYYLLILPSNYYDSSDFPLVIALHGTGGKALQCEHDYKLTEKANAENYIIVYPEGVQSDGVLGIRTWNAGYCCDYAAQNNIDDVKFINSLIDRLNSSFKTNPRKVYVTGISNGAMMAYRLACEIPNKIAAIAPVSGTMLTTSPCNPSRVVPVLHIHSENDSKVPPQGGIGIGGYYFPPVDSVLRVWAMIDSCNSTEPTISVFENYSKYQWQNNRDGICIEYYLTKDGGHAWPGGLKSRDRADTPSKAIDANDLIWAFFKKHELP